MANNNHKITIDVHAEYIPNQSSPAHQRYAFAYTITITNHSYEPVKLLSRHWIITDGNDQKQEVKGEGVVGEQPRILPSKSYRYTSGALLETAVGTMEGSYQMISDSGKTFDAPIEPFSLTHAGSLH